VETFLFLALAGQTTLSAQGDLAPAERRIASQVDERTPAAVALLQRTVKQNSGTLNPAGVRAVYDLRAPHFPQMCFEVRWVQLPSETGRSGHLVAERRGTTGKSLLLIGHLDTVFEPNSPFQSWTRVGDFATGPGAVDMKGGNIVILLALQALHDEGALDDASIAVVMTGDEEAPGRPLEVVRRDLFLAGERADIALGFENSSRLDGVDLAIVARRSWSSWRLEVGATSAHSSLLFRDEIGAGAIYEAARILDTFYEDLRGEPYLTFNVGVLLGGSQVSYDAARAGGTADGKNNVIPQAAIATGDIRAM
jgi:glutamate carboxypeptidase